MNRYNHCGERDKMINNRNNNKCLRYSCIEIWEYIVIYLGKEKFCEKLSKKIKE